MTPERARTRANRWFAVAVVCLIARTGLAAVGIDLLGLPLGLVGALAFAFTMQHTGWISGYRANSDSAKEHL